MVLLHNATLVTGQGEKKGSILIEGDRISKIWDEDFDFPSFFMTHKDAEILELDGKHVFAGGIDLHVHFREPGMTHKADMASESRAAVLGGVTSFVDMPNTNPLTTTVEALKEKLELAQGRCAANYGFHIGATNSNLEEIKNAIGEHSDIIAGVKVFMGSSTGNMLVDDSSSLGGVFDIKEKPVLVHCEEESVIKAGLEAAKARYGEEIPFEEHENIRSRYACFKSSMKALELAMEHGTRLHLCHVSTIEEAEMVRAAKMHNPEITAETSPNYLWFCNEDYKSLGARVKCNPSIKTAEDRQKLRTALLQGTIDSIGTDHAPHLLSEKDAPYTKCPSGMPSIQHSLPMLLTIAGESDMELGRVASAFSEKPAEICSIKDRGFLKEGFFADIVVVDLNREFTVRAEDLAYKCGWSPLEGATLRGAVDMVYVNGVLQDKEALRRGEGTASGRALEYR